MPRSERDDCQRFERKQAGAETEGSGDGKSERLRVKNEEVWSSSTCREYSNAVDEIIIILPFWVLSRLEDQLETEAKRR